jgi:hypothetical protein
MSFARKNSTIQINTDHGEKRSERRPLRLLLEKVVGAGLRQH